VVRIVAVSYLNTLPMVYGIRHNAPLWLADGLELAVPSACADALAAGRADVGLIPVAQIPQIAGARVVTDFCISARGAVRTVALLSKVPLHQIAEVALDPDSRTSVELVKILARSHWNISPRWISDWQGFSESQAIVAIGDKVFELEHQYPYVYDLSLEWQQMTGLPFVFAAWVAVGALAPEVEPMLNSALEYGVNHIWESVAHLPDPHKAIDYLTNNISFRLDAHRHQAMALFLSMIR
jgi:chorismate dehydratase